MVFLPADTKKELEMSKFGVLEPRYDAKKIQKFLVLHSPIFLIGVSEILF